MDMSSVFCLKYGMTDKPIKYSVSNTVDHEINAY